MGSHLRLPRLTVPRNVELAAIALLVLIVGVYVLYTRTGNGGGGEAAASEKTATELAGWLGGALTSELGQLRSAAEREPLATLLSGGDQVALRGAEGRLAHAHADVLRVRLLPRGYSQADYGTRPPITYATLSLLQRSETGGKAPPIEGQLLGSDQQQLVLLVRVQDSGGALRGHALFSLKPTLIQHLLDAVPWPGGAAEIIQPVERASPAIVARRGDASTAPASVRDIPGTTWRVSYRAPRAAEVEARTGWAPWVWSLGAAALLLLAGAGGWELQRRRRAVPTAEIEAENAPVPEYAPVSHYEPQSVPALPTVEEISSVEPPAPHVAAAAAKPPSPEEGLPDPSLFLAYDIRGVVGQTLDAEVARAIGGAIGSEAYDRGQQALVVARDGRTSSPELARALIEGLVKSGRDVIDIGQVPTPVLYFAAEYLDTHSGVMVTGSHNPAQYNGFKVLLADEVLAGPAISALRRRLVDGDVVTGVGSVQSLEMDAEYIRRVTEDIPAALGNAYKVVVDGANGVAGEIAPRLYRALGHDVIEIHCEVDGDFPHHAPDPTQPENLSDLIAAVREHKADLGFAFDGDGDRLVVVDGQGEVIWPDRLLMLFAFDVLSRNPGATVVYDVKCSARLGRVVRKLGGTPVMWKSGHSLIKAKMRETGALVAGEGSGHICIRDRWYGFDDALYAGARLLEILRGRGGTPTAVFARLPTGMATPELRVPMSATDATDLMGRIPADAFGDATVTTLDGLRADWPDGWGLVRTSNTTPDLILRFEGDDEEALRRVQARFREILLSVEPGLALPF